MIKSFTYTKADGSSTDRVVLVLKEPTEMLLALDITEFSLEERAIYIAEVEEAEDTFKQSIKNAGLGSQYRFFKKEGISYSE